MSTPKTNKADRVYRCPRCGNRTPGHGEGREEYCTACGGVLQPHNLEETVAKKKSTRTEDDWSAFARMVASARPTLDGMVPVALVLLEKAGTHENGRAIVDPYGPHSVIWVGGYGDMVGRADLLYRLAMLHEPNGGAHVELHNVSGE